MKFQAERFAALIQAVGNAPGDQLDMSTWLSRDDCGTVGCACGWYAVANPKLFKVQDDGDGGCDIIIREGGHEMSLDRWAPHFGINLDEASILFCPAGHPDKEAVLAYLRAFYASKTEQERTTHERLPRLHPEPSPRDQRDVRRAARPIHGRRDEQRPCGGRDGEGRGGAAREMGRNELAPVTGKEERPL